MSIHLKRDIEYLKQELMGLAALVEANVAEAVQAVMDRDADKAQAVINKDAEIDSREVELEEECLKTLALNQPVAQDLRLIVAVMKINNDLERIGDLAANIAERGIRLSYNLPVEFGFDLHRMNQLVEQMLRGALDALVHLDPEGARRIGELDDEVDAMHAEVYGLVKAKVAEEASAYEALLQYLMVSRHLERIADLATNIAEDVQYLLTGHIVRHRK